MLAPARFLAARGFIGFATAAVLLATGTIAPAQTWTATSPGNLLTGSNWSGGSAPNSTGAVAIILHQPTDDGDFTLNGSMTFGRLDYETSVSRAISGTGSLHLAASSGSAIIFVDPATLTINTPITGSTLNKTGNGTLVLTAANTYTGATTISQGMLQFAKTNSMSSGAVTVASGATFAVNVGGAGEWNSSASGLDSIGRLIAGDNTTGNSNQITWNSGSTLAIDTGWFGSVTYAANIGNFRSGTGSTTNSVGLTKLDYGTLTLSGANTYTGATTISSGTLQFGKTNSMASGPVTVSDTLAVNAGGTSEWNSGTTGLNSIGRLIAGDNSAGTANQITWNNGSYLGIDTTNAPGGSLTYTGNIGNFRSGTGSTTNSVGLTKLGTGNLTLSGANTFTGNTNVYGGTISITNGGSISHSGNYDVISNGTLSVGGGAGTSTLTDFETDVYGSGTLNITSGGAVTSSYGYLSYSSTANIGGGTGASSWTAYGLFVGNGGAGTLNITGGGTVTSSYSYLGSYYSDSTGIANIGGGTGMSNWTVSDLYVGYGGTGTLNITGGGTVNSQDGYLGLSYGAGEDSYFGTGTANVGGGTGASSWNIANDLYVGYSGTGTLNITSGGLVTAAALSGYGSVNFDGGALSITATGSSLNAINLLSGGGTIDVPNSGTTFTVTSNIGGTGALIKTGTGTLSLTGSNSYSGTTNISGGVLNVGSANALAGGGAITFTGGTLQYSAANTSDYSARFSTSPGQVFRIDTNGQNVTFATGLSSNAGELYKTGAGTLTMTGASSYNSQTLVDAGTLSVTNGGSIIPSCCGGGSIGYSVGSNGAVSIGGGTGTSSWISSNAIFVGLNGVGSLSIIDGGSVSSGGGVLGTFAGSTGTATVGSGTGSAIWTMQNILYVGQSGTGILNLSTGGKVSASALDGGNATSSVNFNGGTLSITGTGSASNTMNLQSGGGTIDVPASGTTFTIISNISGTGGLTKTGAGTMTVSGSNSYGGTTTIAGGTLAGNTIADSGTNSAFGAGANFSISNGATLAYTGPTASTNRSITLGNGGGAVSANSGTTLTLTGAISGTGGFAKSGAGAIALTGDNRYTGGTTISAGTLLAKNTSGSATGTGAVNINGGTLGGTGTISGPVTLAAGTLAPGSSIGTLNLGSSLTLTSGTFEWQFNSMNPAADLVNVQGALSISPNVSLELLDLGPGPIGAGTKFTIISYDVQSNPGMFAGAPDDTVITYNNSAYLINYNDVSTGTVNGGAYQYAVTLTAVPEASSFLALGLVAVLALITAGVKNRRV